MFSTILTTSSASNNAPGYHLRFEDVCFSLGQIVCYGFLAGVFIRETFNGYRRFQGPRHLTTGAFVRIWFLGLLATGLTLKTIVVIAIYWYIKALNKPPIPFTVAWSHCLPSLVMLSGYSMAAVFFAEVCCKSNSVDLPLLTPFLVGSNAILYLLFSVVTSITKLRHAHREFRIAAYSLIGVSHLILALAWLYFGVRLQLQLKSRTHQLTNQVVYTEVEEVLSPSAASTKLTLAMKGPFRSPPHTRLSEESINQDSREQLSICPVSSRRITSAGSSTTSRSAISLQQREVVTELLQRIVGLCWICPTLFAANGVLELIVAKQLYRATQSATPPPNVDYYIEWSSLNALLCGTQLLPAVGVALLMWPEFCALKDYYAGLNRWWPWREKSAAEQTFPFLMMNDHEPPEAQLERYLPPPNGGPNGLNTPLLNSGKNLFLPYGS